MWKLWLGGQYEQVRYRPILTGHKLVELDALKALCPTLSDFGEMGREWFSREFSTRLEYFNKFRFLKAERLCLISPFKIFLEIELVIQRITLMEMKCAKVYYT